MSHGHGRHRTVASKIILGPGGMSATGGPRPGRGGDGDQQVSYLRLGEEDPPLPPLSQGELHGLGVGHGACAQPGHAGVETVAHVGGGGRAAHEAGDCKIKD